MSAKPTAVPSFPPPTSNSVHPPLPVSSTADDANTDINSVHTQMDPAQPRTFFPYIPNEVKHRKRTTRHQLKVLEDVFRKDTKPNAVLRKKLATELEMSPRAVQVWFQNRRAKEKAHRRRVSSAIDQEKPVPFPLKTSANQDASPNESTASLTPTEKPNVSVAVSSHVRPPLLLDANSQELDPYSARRGSLPAVMPSQPFTGPAITPFEVHYPDRRKSMDVNFFRLAQHPFARFAKERNEALYLSKSPLSPAGSTQANLMRNTGIMPGIGPIRNNGHGYRPNLSHRASEPQVFAPVRTPFPPVPETGPLQSHPAPSRRFSDNRLYAITSRPLVSPIPGPLPTPDFQFGNPSSGSPSNGSPTPGPGDSPPVPRESPDIAQLQRWSFPRSHETDQDTEDSGSYCGLSRFGSVASISGSDSSAVYSDVSSCVAVDRIGYDPSARRGSCASGGYLEMQLSGLSMTGRSSQGSLNEAQLCVSAAHAYRDKLGQRDQSLDVTGGYISPASTASPGTSPLVRQVTESPPSVLQSESIYEYDPVLQVSGNDAIVTRRGSIQTPEPLSQLYVSNHLDLPYPTPPTEAGTSPVLPTVQQSYPLGGTFMPPTSFSASGESSFVGGSAQVDPSYPQQPPNPMQYSPQATFQGTPSAMVMPHTNMSGYVPTTDEYTFAVSHGKEPFTSMT